jgi:hypothetical protein
MFNLKHMSFEELPTPEKEKKISNYTEAIEYLKKEGEDGAKSEPFQNFVEQEENKVENHIQGLELAFRLAVVYYIAGFKDYALESFGEIEEAEDYIMEETDLFARLRKVKEGMEADQEIGTEFFNE